MRRNLPPTLSPSEVAAMQATAEIIVAADARDDVERAAARRRLIADTLAPKFNEASALAKGGLADRKRARVIFRELAAAWRARGYELEASNFDLLARGRAPKGFLP